MLGKYGIEFVKTVN